MEVGMPRHKQGMAARIAVLAALATAVTVSAVESRETASAIKPKAAGDTVAEWRVKQGAHAAALGGFALVPGPAAIAAMLAEIPLLLRLMSVCALGTGFALNGDAADDDYLLILSVWSGELSLNDTLKTTALTHLKSAGAAAVSSAAGAAIAKTVVGSSGAAVAPANISTKLTASLPSGVIVGTIGRKSATAASSTLISKFCAIIVGSLPARCIPLLGAAVCAGVNVALIQGIIDAEERYYTFQDGIRKSLAV
jgi:hypothetical protein